MNLVSRSLFIYEKRTEYDKEQLNDWFWKLRKSKRKLLIKSWE